MKIRIAGLTKIVTTAIVVVSLVYEITIVQVAMFVNIRAWHTYLHGAQQP